MKKTVVLGATTNPERTAYTAVHRLLNTGHEVILIGVKPGVVAGIAIVHGQPQIEDVHTVTLYINPEIQRSYYEYLLELQPKRIIFNPGTENPELQALALAKGIAVENACTLVLLATNSY